MCLVGKQELRILNEKKTSLKRERRTSVTFRLLVWYDRSESDYCYQVNFNIKEIRFYFTRKQMKEAINESPTKKSRNKFMK